MGLIAPKNQAPASTTAHQLGIVLGNQRDPGMLQQRQCHPHHNPLHYHSVAGTSFPLFASRQGRWTEDTSLNIFPPATLEGPRQTGQTYRYSPPHVHAALRLNLQPVAYIGSLPGGLNDQLWLVSNTQSTSLKTRWSLHLKSTHYYPITVIYYKMRSRHKIGYSATRHKPALCQAWIKQLSVVYQCMMAFSH